MLSPNGSEQVLSLKWILEQIAGFSPDEAIQAICGVFGIQLAQWEFCAHDTSWFIGDSRWHKREKVETLWNERFSKLTGVWLEEDVWFQPLWKAVLSNPKMVFAANLSYLISMGGLGTVGQLAKYTNRNRATASKWGKWKKEGKGVRVPPKTVVPKILEFFGLKQSIDLTNEPLFLGRSEISDEVLRFQARHYLAHLAGDSLKQAVAYLRDEANLQAAKLAKDYSNLK
jgi:hypothetical protein